MLADKVAVDVAIVGAGIVGITAARRLKAAGRKVAVLESKRALHGVTATRRRT